MSQPILSVTNLGKTYLQGGTAVEVLNDLSLSVEQGDTVAILGQSGSGKSTLLSLLGGLDRATQGKIELRGTDLGSLSEEALAAYRARDIGIIFQQFHLLSNLTAVENISLPLELQSQDNALERAEQALKDVGLAHRRTHFPSQLSGGERQRIAIARALVIRPAVLLADEPSGNLDPKTGTQIMELLFNLVTAEKSTLLLVTHNEELAKRCARRLTLAEGRLHPTA